MRAENQHILARRSIGVTFSPSGTENEIVMLWPHRGTSPLVARRERFSESLLFDLATMNDLPVMSKVDSFARNQPTFPGSG
jgi:hypothetical protein